MITVTSDGSPTEICTSVSVRIAIAGIRSDPITGGMAIIDPSSSVLGEADLVANVDVTDIDVARAKLAVVDVGPPSIADIVAAVVSDADAVLVANLSAIAIANGAGISHVGMFPVGQIGSTVTGTRPVAARWPPVAAARPLTRTSPEKVA